MNELLNYLGVKRYNIALHRDLINNMVHLQ